MSADHSRLLRADVAADEAVDRVVEQLKAALHRNGILLPSLRSDIVPTRGQYLVELGRASQEVVLALAAVLDRAASSPLAREAAEGPEHLS